MRIEDLDNPYPAYLDLSPAEVGAARHWSAYPTDELTYEDFIRCVLQVASRAIGQHVTNAIVDFSSEVEESPLLQGVVPGGWNDPDCLHVGGASRICRDTDVVFQEEPAWAQMVTREFSFLRADVPTWIEDEQRRDACLYIQLIKPLVDLVGATDDNLYGWLEHMFAFCSGHHVAYFSDYIPGPLIQAIARAHRVSLTHLSLHTIPSTALAENRGFRQLRLTVSQWRELEVRFRSVGLIREAELIREHGG